MSLSGVPLFFSGAWTKEEILHGTSHWPKSPVPHFLLLAGVMLTALYMARQMAYVFFGKPRAASKNAQESPPVMTVPLIVLVFCTIFFSVVLTPAWPWLLGYLTGEPAQFTIEQMIQPMFFVSLALVAAGIGLGVLIYRKAGETDPLQQSQPALFRFLENKMWIDEIYEWTVIAFARTAARVSDWMDRQVWDGLVRSLGELGQLFGVFSTNVDERGINAGVDETMTGARGLGRVMSRWHSGQIQTYLGAIAIGMLALLILYAWLT
jgi:NADH-quinone oxidoreductase subunit L